MLSIDTFDFQLPLEQIASHPSEQRSHSRLLCLNRDKQNLLQHAIFYELPRLLNKGDLLVFNNSRVIPARLLGNKLTGAKIEVLIERIIGAHTALAHIRGSRRLKPGMKLSMEGGWELTVGLRQQSYFQVIFPEGKSPLEWLEAYGHIPLPPYINRPDEVEDKERYQTVYSRYKGSVAAPTAGLHFDEALLQNLTDHQIGQAFLTLHVGAGTFQSVRCKNLADHTMHQEWIALNETVVAQIAETKARGNRVIAVGTTVVRTLETAALSGTLKPYEGETDIFIYPGFKFQCVDGMITNFHLPKSTLLMLVCAFAGTEVTLQAYNTAIESGYRFFSYGDAMLIL